jgi:hypothetical protein
LLKSHGELLTWITFNLLPLNPKHGFLFQFCDIENLTKFSKALATLVEFTLKKEILKFPNSFVKRMIKLLEKKNCSQGNIHSSRVSYLAGKKS